MTDKTDATDIHSLLNKFQQATPVNDQPRQVFLTGTTIGNFKLYRDHSDGKPQFKNVHELIGAEIRFSNHMAAGIVSPESTDEILDIEPAGNSCVSGMGIRAATLEPGLFYIASVPNKVFEDLCAYLVKRVNVLDFGPGAYHRLKLIDVTDDSVLLPVHLLELPESYIVTNSGYVGQIWYSVKSAAGKDVNVTVSASDVRPGKYAVVDTRSTDGRKHAVQDLAHYVKTVEI